MDSGIAAQPSATNVSISSARLDIIGRCGGGPIGRSRSINPIQRGLDTNNKKKGSTSIDWTVRTKLKQSINARQCLLGNLTSFLEAIKNDNNNSENDAAIEAMCVCFGVVEGLVDNTKEKSSSKQAHNKFWQRPNMSHERWFGPSNRCNTIAYDCYQDDLNKQLWPKIIWWTFNTLHR